MSLRNLIEDELPLNRKERFFTGTVFPMKYKLVNEQVNNFLLLLKLPFKVGEILHTPSRSDEGLSALR
ncbi:hypothetical protein ACFLVN_02675 [Chloroflexota bacterium]